MKPVLHIEEMVIPGAGVGGAKLGFPTLNVGGKYDLPFGVYVAQVRTPKGVFRGALHYGSRASVGHKDVVLEVHLLDFEGELTGETVTIDVYTKVRDTRDFDSANDLKEQIARDVEMVRNASL